MRYLPVQVLGLLIVPTSAYPQSIVSVLGGAISALGKDAVDAFKNSAANTAANSFDAQLQYIDVTGFHEFQPPGPNDARGPCPGLNALANHGYLPRNGYADIIELTTACTNVYGMGLDLASILAAYGAIFDGAAVGWSIGGEEHTGISGSHNNYETDSSPMRGDLNQYGSNVNLVMSQFEELFNMQPDAETANYDVNVLMEFRAKRYNQSVAQNPYFYYGPFAGTTVSQAAFFFIYRFMANHTAEQPDGILNQDVLKSFFAITGSPSSSSSPSTLSWQPGHERIPDNWYKRNPSSPYGLSPLTDDIGTLVKTYPGITRPGCNQGRVNSWVAITDPQTNSSFYDFETNPLAGVCYGIAAATALADELPIVPVVLGELLVPFQNALGCPLIQNSNASIGETCPGYSVWGGPEAAVANGALQSS